MVRVLLAREPGGRVVSSIRNGDFRKALLMNKLKNSIISGATVAWALLGSGSVWADEPTAPPPAGEQPAPAGEQPASAASTAMTTPALTGPLVANPNPISFDAGPLGPVYWTGVVSGLGMWQNNVFPGDQHALASLSNGQFSFQKTDGLFQYYLQVGAYTIPDLGAPYFNVLTTTGDFFGPLPIAWAKVAPTDTFSIQGGQLPTLIGAEKSRASIRPGRAGNREPWPGPCDILRLRRRNRLAFRTTRRACNAPFNIPELLRPWRTAM